MAPSILFLVNSLMLGVGLAMDAFSVSVVNGISEPCMKFGKAALIAGVFAFFQALMPMTGWVITRTMVSVFGALERIVPWISLALLCFIGISMIRESQGCEVDSECRERLSVALLLTQGVATSIDALSVGLTISEYGVEMACICSLIIAAVTFVICIIGVLIGRRIGVRLSRKATFIGGLVLILVGVEIFLTSF